MQIFEELKENKPNVLNKLVAIGGDVTKKDLAISPEDEEKIINNVSGYLYCFLGFRTQRVKRDPITKIRYLSLRRSSGCTALELTPELTGLFRLSLTIVQVLKL